jgi:hypothetical protein
VMTIIFVLLNLTSLADLSFLSIDSATYMPERMAGRKTNRVRC